MNRALVIYGKELKDTLRDRRTLAMMILVPMVTYPLALLVTSETIALERKAAEERRFAVRFEGEPIPELAAELSLEHGVGVDLAAETSSTSSAARRVEARRLLKDGSAEVLIYAAPGARRALARGGQAALTLYYDSADPFGETAASRVERAVEAVAERLREERRERHGLPPEFMHPLALTRVSVASARELGDLFLASALPALLLLFISLSSYYPAVDLTAGEKERRTLATLLTAPISARDVVLGKYLAVLTVGLLAGLLNVVVLALTLLRVVAEARSDAAEVGLSLGLVFPLVVAVLAMAAPVGALMLLFASFARSFRDAGYLLTPVLLLTMAPAALTGLPSFQLDARWAVVPLVNAALMVKAVLLDQARLGLMIAVVLSSLLATVVILGLNVRAFQDERVLFSSEGRRADLRTVLGEPPPITASTALALAALMFAGNYFGSVGLAFTSPLLAVAATQLLAHAAPPLLLARWLAAKERPTSLLALGAPGPRALIAALLLGLGAWLGLSLPMGWLTDLLVPGQAEAAEAFRDVLDLGRTPLPWTLLTLALLPALAEELAFRGALQRLLAGSFRAGGVLVAQAVVFGAMHGSIHRFLPTAALGLLLGWLRHRTGSIWPGVLAHALTNAILLSVDRLAPEPVAAALSAPTPWAVAGAGLVAAGLLLLPRAKPAG